MYQHEGFADDWVLDHTRYLPAYCSKLQLPRYAVQLAGLDAGQLILARIA